MYKEERYSRTLPDGTSESRILIERQGSGLGECCAVMILIAILGTYLAIILNHGNRQGNSPSRSTEEVVRDYQRKAN
ncbi:MAG TPA: hypothetical protein VE956_00075 [Nodularia sp. (in: cyanobacteria)]|nr:hypothetical protein [Nodularia sp. (in: cyanobacteria)]